MYQKLNTIKVIVVRWVNILFFSLIATLIANASAMATALTSDFNYERKTIEITVDGVTANISYIDVGDPTKDPIVFTQGNPTYSYLWRNIIPHVEDLGRIIAFDAVGTGFSDRPPVNIPGEAPKPGGLNYDYFDNMAFADAFVDKLQLNNITFVQHDWLTGVFGFDYAARNPDNVKALAWMETPVAPLIPTATIGELPTQFAGFQEFLRSPAGIDMIVNQGLFLRGAFNGPADGGVGVINTVSDEIWAAYREPWLEAWNALLDAGTLEGSGIDDLYHMLQFPLNMPVEGLDSPVGLRVAAYNNFLLNSDIPKLALYGSPGLILGSDEIQWQLDNFSNMQAVHIGPALHYVPEDNPHGVADALRGWLQGQVTDVPEPDALMLMGFGLIVGGSALSRKRRKEKTKAN